MIYRLDNFIENSINPITNQPYDDYWIIWRLTDSKGSRQGTVLCLRCCS